MAVNKKMFFMVVLSFFLVSILILFMPLSSDRAQNGDFRMLYLLGGGFWGLLFTAYILLIILFARMKKMNNYKNIKINGKTRIIKFFKNRNAKISDITLILSSVLFLVTMMTVEKSNYIICVLLALVFLSLHMHFLFNSKMYYIIKNVE